MMSNDYCSNRLQRTQGYLWLLQYYIKCFIFMRFGQALGDITIPEWKECYLNYEVLKIFVMIIKEIVQAIQVQEQLMKELNEPDNSFGNNQQLQLRPDIKAELKQIRTKLNIKLATTNQLFFKTYIFQAEITELFYQMKVMQIQERYQICARLQSKNIDKQHTPLFLTYIQYAYIQISYLSEMRQANLQAERKILKKHKKYAKKLIQTPSPSHQKITRMASIEQQYINKIEDLYVGKCKDMQSKVARQFLRLAAHKDDKNELDFLFVGIGIGASIIVLGSLIFIIIYAGLSVENNSIFSRDFPTWRGIGIFILYIWVLGFDLYCFEKYKISHRLIFKFNDHHYSTSAEVFKLAGFFTTLFLALFLIYLLQITKIITNSSSFAPQYLVLIVWFSVFTYLFLPLPFFNHEGRLYALRLMLRCLISPVMGVQFSIVWMTDQWISMTTPLRDLAYTACYYGRLDFADPSINPCKNNTRFEVILLVVVIAISYRIMQCIRLGTQEGTFCNFFCSIHFANFIKYSLSLISAIVSYVYNLGYPDFLWVWVAFSICSTCYSYYWDLKNDWSLLQPGSKNVLLRKYLTFQPKRNYYIVIVLNFIMRLSWMLTLSPNIATIFGNSNLLTFVTGSIEIIRRGIWNLLRVEKQHLNNCVEFKAIPDMINIERRLQLQQETQLEIRVSWHPETNVEPIRRGTENDIRQIIKKEFIALIKAKINQRDDQQRQYDEQYEHKNIEQVKKMKKKIKSLGKKLKGQG